MVVPTQPPQQNQTQQDPRGIYMCDITKYYVIHLYSLVHIRTNAIISAQRTCVLISTGIIHHISLRRPYSSIHPGEIGSNIDHALLFRISVSGWIRIGRRRWRAISLHFGNRVHLFGTITGEFHVVVVINEFNIRVECEWELWYRNGMRHAWHRDCTWAYTCHGSSTWLG